VLQHLSRRHPTRGGATPPLGGWRDVAHHDEPDDRLTLLMTSPRIGLVSASAVASPLVGHDGRPVTALVLCWRHPLHRGVTSLPASVTRQGARVTATASGGGCATSRAAVTLRTREWVSRRAACCNVGAALASGATPIMDCHDDSRFWRVAGSCAVNSSAAPSKLQAASPSTRPSRHIDAAPTRKGVRPTTRPLRNATPPRRCPMDQPPPRH